MSRLLPKSLFGQTVLILLAGPMISHLAGWWIYSSDREQAVRAVGGFAAAQRITNLTRLVQEAPREWRQRIVAALSDQSFRVALSAQPPASVPTGENSPVAQAIRDFLIEQLPLEPGKEPRVAASLPDGSIFPGWHLMMRPGPMMHGFGGFGPFGAFGDLRVTVPLPDGQWLTFTTVLPERGPAVSQQFLVSMALMAVIILAVSLWAVQRVTAPPGRLGQSPRSCLSAPRLRLTQRKALPSETCCC